jgi:hypothetical protein
MIFFNVLKRALFLGIVLFGLLSSHLIATGAGSGARASAGFLPDDPARATALATEILAGGAVSWGDYPDMTNVNGIDLYKVMQAASKQLDSSYFIPRFIAKRTQKEATDVARDLVAADTQLRLRCRTQATLIEGVDSLDNKKGFALYSLNKKMMVADGLTCSEEDVLPDVLSSYMRVCLLDWCACRNCPEGSRYLSIFNTVHQWFSNVSQDEMVSHVDFGSGRLKYLYLLSRCLFVVGFKNITFVGIDPIYADPKTKAYFQETVERLWGLIPVCRFSLQLYPSADSFLAAADGEKRGMIRSLHAIDLTDGSCSDYDNDFHKIGKALGRSVDIGILNMFV